MGTVYRVRDRYSGHRVALKLLHAGRGTAEESERFAREAQLLSELRHPGIVSYVAHGQTPDGQRFLAMEWLDGQDLGQRLASGPLPIRDCIALLKSVAEALAIAHQRGIVHRDIKPSNLFLVGAEIERVKLLDFGIARRLAPSPTLTRTGMVVGTPEYMSPEQARGGRDLLPAADLFSIGCVLYECLAGEPPYVAEHIAAVLVRILFQEPPPIETRRPGVPTPLANLLSRLLCKDPAARLPNAMALRHELSLLGQLAEPELAMTLPAPTPAPMAFAESEQSLFSIVLAAPPEEVVAAGATLPETPSLSGAERQDLVQRLVSLGVVPDFLTTGALVVTVPAVGSAQDQATLAARAALVIKSRWPVSAVSVATGRGMVKGHTTIGEVVDHAAQLLRHSQLVSTANTTEVLLDALSGKLLEGRFAQTPQPDGVLRLGVELEADASRPLLGKPTPCVGREAELSNLEEQLRSSIEEQEARVILVTAPPGMGKSRLRHEFLRRMEAKRESVTLLFGCGDLLAAGAPYGILATAIRRLCGLTGSEPLELQQQRLRERISQHLPPEEQERVVVFVGELCKIPFPSEGRPMLRSARQDPRIMADALRRAGRDWLRTECAAQPVLLVLDDLHWGDALTVALVDEVLQGQQGAPLCVVALARPEVHGTFPKLWQSHRLQEVVLRPLSKKACERLIQQVLGKAAPAESVARAVEQSAGNALFLEEMIRAISEGKSEGPSETVVAMLQARIGRLSAGPRRALRAASVFGQTVWRDGVRSLLSSGTADTEIEGWLTALVDAELLQPLVDSRFGNEQEYGFRHALVREAAYGLLTDSDLLAGHRLAGEWLERAGERDAKVLAQHFERGGEPTRAAAHYMSAAEQAIEAGDNAAAISMAERGRSLGQKHELIAGLMAIESEAKFWVGDFQSAARAGREALAFSLPGSRTESRALHASIFAAMLLHDADTLGELSERLLKTNPEPDALALLASASFSVIVSFLLTAERGRAELYLRRLEEVTTPHAERNPIAMAWLELARSMWALHVERDFWGMAEHSQTALAYYDQSKVGGYFPFAKLFVASAHGYLGVFERSETELLRMLQALPPTGIEALTLQISRAFLALQQRRLEDAVSVATFVVQEACTRNDHLQSLHGRLLLIEAHLYQGALAIAEADALALSEAAAEQPYIGMAHMTVLARIRLGQGRAAEAAEIAQRAYSQSLACGMGYSIGHAMLLLVRAESFRALDNYPAACDAIREAEADLLRRAAKIPDAEVRRCFLERIPDHRRTIELAREWLGAEAQSVRTLAC